MKKATLAFIIALLTGTPAIAQKCNLFLKDTGSIELMITTYNTPFMNPDQKFAKMKDAKKDEEVLKFNAMVYGGQVTPASKYPLTYRYKKAIVPDGDEYTLTTNIAGKDYSSYLVCNSDTLYFARNRGPVEVPNADGSVFGYTIQGIMVLPMRIKVGDVLPKFDDISIVLPTSKDITVQKTVFSHMATKTTDHYGYATDSRTGETGFGSYTKTTTSAVYKNIDVEVRQTISTNNHVINYMFAEVTAEEDVTVNDKKYRAYVIESQSWSKSKMDISYESADERVNREQTELSAKMMGKFDKMMVRRSFTNPLGYMVIYKKEWFVPELGTMAKVEAFDMFGAIVSVTSVTGLK